MTVWTRASLLARHLSRRSSKRGALPDFLLLGAQKAGTTSLFHHLCRSPDVLPPLRKEIHYFDQVRLPPMDWYRAFFDARSDGPGTPITGEATPLYLFHPDVAQRIHDAGLNPKFLVILRCPIDRAWSHYRHEKRKGREDRPFAEALAAEVGRLDEMERHGVDRERLKFLKTRSYLGRGRYHAQIERYRDLFGADRLHIVTLDDLHAQPADTIASCCDFLGIRTPGEDGAYRALNAGNDNKPMPEVDPSIFRTAFEQDLAKLAGIFPPAETWHRRVLAYGEHS